MSFKYLTVFILHVQYLPVQVKGLKHTCLTKKQSQHLSQFPALKQHQVRTSKHIFSVHTVNQQLNTFCSCMFLTVLYYFQSEFCSIISKTEYFL